MSIAPLPRPAVTRKYQAGELTGLAAVGIIAEAILTPVAQKNGVSLPPGSVAVATSSLLSFLASAARDVIHRHRT